MAFASIVGLVWLKVAMTWSAESGSGSMLTSSFGSMLLSSAALQMFADFVVASVSGTSSSGIKERFSTGINVVVVVMEGVILSVVVEDIHDEIGCRSVASLIVVVVVSMSHVSKSTLYIKSKILLRGLTFYFKLL
jgi:hypothetical protein